MTKTTMTKATNWLYHRGGEKAGNNSNALRRSDRKKQHSLRFVDEYQYGAAAAISDNTIDDVSQSQKRIRIMTDDTHTNDTPTTYQEAITCTEAEQWKRAID